MRAATGRPLLALAGLVACWIAARAALWEMPPRPEVVKPFLSKLIDLASVSVLAPHPLPLTAVRPLPHRTDMVVLARVKLARVATAAVTQGTTGSSYPGTGELRPVGSASLAASPVPAVPRAPASRLASADHAEPGFAPISAPARRWRADIWLALRQGGAVFQGSGLAAPVYGASQAGAVLRYRLAPASRSDPVAYVRVIQAIDRREIDLAVGLGARLVPSGAVVAHVEARASKRADQTEIRPAAFLTAGFDDAEWPLQLHVRGYAQAGYVGGRDATVFADGSLVTERILSRSDRTSLGLGAGAWGGAQRGAGRLDAGPSASLRFPLGKGAARIAVDYRMRVAGNAEPASGAALTLSAGF